MISIEELTKEVSSLKVSSEQLSGMFGMASEELNKSTMSIAALVKGSRSGQDAVSALGMATKSLRDASMTIRDLSRTCDECVVELSK